jgi:acyl carrier protein
MLVFLEQGDVPATPRSQAAERRTRGAAAYYKNVCHIVRHAVLRSTRIVDNSTQQTIMRYRLAQKTSEKIADMSAQSSHEKELAELIVECLNLEDVGADEIEPEEPLFGEGLGLDSIDALELALAITQKYGVQLKADDANIQEVFGSLRSLSAYIAEKTA